MPKSMKRAILIEIEADKHGHEHVTVALSGDGVDSLSHREIGDYILKRMSVAIGRSIASLYPGRDSATRALADYSISMVTEIAEGHKAQRKGVN